jgi:hypothetical protein
VRPTPVYAWDPAGSLGELDARTASSRISSGDPKDEGLDRPSKGSHPMAHSLPWRSVEAPHRRPRRPS